MPILNDYHHFDGRHAETGSLHNILAYQGAIVPQTGKPISEALLLGISGGIAFGYFTFHYEGYLPHVALLTRNTFDPLNTIFERLALPQEVYQTQKPDKAVTNVIEALESGHPALVWADQFSLPYDLLEDEDNMWMMQPLVVFGQDEHLVHIADRSSQPFEVEADTFLAARARVKKEKFRVMTIDPPEMDRLPAAVQKGIWQCISLFTEAPPKGTRDNFGFAALEKWAAMLVNTRNKQSWERVFPAGSALFHALAGGLFHPGAVGWLHNGAERDTYAAFLREAALILDKPALNDVAVLFEQSADTWRAVEATLLPDDVPLLNEARTLKAEKHRLFVEQGQTALDDIAKINARFREIQATVATDYPMHDDAVQAHKARIAEAVRAVIPVERDAVNTLQAAMA